MMQQGTPRRPAGPSQGHCAAVRLAAWACIAALGLAAAASVGYADEPTLDDLLDLDPQQPSDSPDDAAPDDAAPPADAGEVELDEDVRRMLRGEEAADAFEEAVRQMDGVSQRLSRDLDPGLATQREQESILAKLDQVIEAARQMQQSSSSSSSSGSEGDPGQQQPREQDAGAQDLAQQNTNGQDGQNGKAASQSAQQQGSGEHNGQPSPGDVIEGEQGDGPLEELRREWGQLPPRLRDEISEGLQERFSPTYRSLTEAYYRRLAEEE